MDSSVCWPTCGWSVSPVDWTWYLPGFAAGQQCSSLSSYASSQDPLLLRHILFDLLKSSKPTYRSNTQRKRESGRLTSRDFIGCQGKEWWAVTTTGSQCWQFRAQTVKEPVRSRYMHFFHFMHSFSSRLMQKCHVLTVHDPSVSSGHSLVVKATSVRVPGLLCQVLWKTQLPLCQTQQQRKTQPDL